MGKASPDEILATAVESARNVKFGRGVVSKTSYVAALVVGVWIMITWRWSDNLVADAGLLISGLVATIFGCWYVHQSQSFAERNPGQALLDGAEFLEYTKLGAATKALPQPPVDEEPAVLPSPRGRGK